MFKRILAALCCLALIFAVGCGKGVVYDDLSTYESENNEQADNSQKTVNPLTGESNVTAEVASRRPVALMVNNISVAQGIQAGLSAADIIYETEVEGGITRLMAVYQDITKIEKIGSIRSARYDYVDLAMAHNAVYVHCGADNTYCGPHLADVSDMSIDSNSKGAKRIANGCASEHTLYAITNDLWENINDKFDTKATSTTPWVNFTDEKLTLTGGSATSVSVPFPTMKTNFNYDESTGLYTRLSNNTVLTDYFTKDETKVKNIFVLLTNMGHYPNGIHRDIDLSSGEGYYVTNGTVQPIKWSKGDAANGFKFTDIDGKDLSVSVGNSWVCIANKSTCTPVFE